MRVYAFTLVLDAKAAIGDPDAFDAAAEALYAVADDATLVGRAGSVLVHVDRAAVTLDVAVTSAIADVEHALPGVRVARLEADAADLRPLAPA